ncbi:MAG: hypothetical protein AUJ41_02545 [Candidatus Pacebacteria bacterium CG1_02_43_31]|nr:hypothetical protein [Candidatus Pacearchaeota archaeon]NCQ65802.1 hypothetical protein [Candidatus Paceibacterota bacterium]OIO44504.1 MAG: hypothetical protein AUJ41_02545 [Candidatus Pacebacteria bacterium CG1_02_43_31]PIQ80617.1 MAG: hypothetical protein COV78_04620 [Candidatus Pacebacteria bacterium CG11_big_fil_rev_8_21_14_0_20_34_55]PJC43454.1 MAG: hypothetical protein CO039_03985 [Candidatus Pacebacteria bacterium CG_4_9_14_0_2_um_filter_34_50]
MLKKIFTKVLIILIALYYAFSLSLPVSAETILFEDDFSNGFEKWESVRDHFDMWSIVDNQADVFINTSSTLAELVPKDFYWNPEWKNIIYELDYNYIQGADKNISFGFRDVLNWYEIHFVGTSYILSHVKNGQVVWDNTGYAHIINNFSNHVSINLNEGKIIVFINNQEVINIEDPTFDNDYGKIGIKAGAGSVYPTHAIYDNIVVRSLDNLISKLSISKQKQTDINWANEEYDSAREWSDNFGIDRWGCLITSISMIMNFHGIDTMPNSEAVNPTTINTWLKTQPDGFIGSGQVNWMAITRLTRLINEEYSTPKLEYKMVPGNELTTAIAEINIGRPVILQIPGHFLVGDGVIEDSTPIPNSDLYITDPAYNFETFSQHQKELISTRTLEPTFTDLSYIHLNHDPTLNVSIQKEDQSEINNLQVFEEYLNDFVSDESISGGGFTENNTPTLQIHEIEKPENGTYVVEVSQDNFGPFEITIFTYTKEGDVSVLSYSGLVGQNKIQFKIFYDNENESNLEKGISFQTLLNDISELFELREIKKHYVAVELTKYAEFGRNSSSENLLRYVDALQQLVEWYSPQLSELGKTYLNQRLLEIKGIILE